MVISTEGLVVESFRCTTPEKDPKRLIMLVLDLYRWIMCLYFSSSPSDLVSITSLVPAWMIKSFLIRIASCLIAGCRDIVQTATRHTHPFSCCFFVLWQNSCSYSFTIDSSMSYVSWYSISSFTRIFNLFKVEMGKNDLVLICGEPFLTGVKSAST